MTSDPSDATDGRPPGTILHIGTMKSGTSYLQDVLDRNTALLAEDGIAYLGRGTRAVWEVLDLRDSEAKDLTGAWKRLVRQTKSAAAPVRLLSMELLSTAGPDETRTIVESLDEVQVVVTARDLVRTIPSAWQNVVKHGSTKTFEAFVDGLVAAAPSRTKERFWRQHDLSTIVARWAEVVGPERVYVVTVPPSGAAPTTLWERFCIVLETDPQRYDAEARQTSNFSLPYSDAELLRKINARLGDALSTEAYNRYVRSFLANEIMRPTLVAPGAPAVGADQAALAPAEARPANGRSDQPTLGPVGHAWAVEHAERIVAELGQSGVTVVGDLDELIPPPPPGDDAAAGPGTPPAVEYPDTAVRVMVQLIRKISDVDPDLAAASTSAAAAAARGAKRAQRRSPARAQAVARRGGAGGPR